MVGFIERSYYDSTVVLFVKYSVAKKRRIEQRKNRPGRGEHRRVIVRTTVSAQGQGQRFSEFISSSLVAARCGHGGRPVCVAQLPVLFPILGESGKVSSFVDAMPFGVQLDFAP